MTAILVPICRGALQSAAWLVPQPLRRAWCENWLGDLWRWMLAEASAGHHEAVRAVVSHTRAGVRDAVWARFQSEPAVEAWSSFRGRPQFSIGVGIGMLAALAIVSGGFAISRQLARGLPYPEADRVVLLAQGPPTLGVRLGFLDSEADLLARQTKTLEVMATYAWSSLRLNQELGGREVKAAGVSADFFRVLRAEPELGRPLSAGTFLVSHEFFERELHADRAAVGRTFQVGRATLRLAGVLPPNFSFLGAPVSIWMLRSAEAPAPKERWWLNLRGTVARLKPEATPESAEADLLKILESASLARNNSKVHATPVSAAVYQASGTYSSLLLYSIAGLLLWTGASVWRDRRSGYSWRSIARFRGFFLAKSALPILTVFLFVFEMMGVNQLGMMGGIFWGRELAAKWVVFCGVAFVAVWAWRDQKRRCRQCLERMRQPVRIGIPGQMLLDPAGEEVMCPRGHGSMYTSESVLGSEMSERWVDLEEQMGVNRES